MNKSNFGIPDGKLIEMYETMLKIRLVEEKCIELHPEQLMKSPHHYYIGQEAVAVGVCVALEKEDHVFSSHRSHGHYIAKGGGLDKFMAEMYCKIDGCSKGKGGSMHLIDTKVGHMGSSGIVSGSIPIAVGSALAFKMQNKKNVAVTFFGDGAADEGILYESINFAALKKLPVIFVCENNFFASFSKVSARWALDNIPGRAEAFGVPAKRVNGMDVIEVYTATQEAVKRARNGQGPSFIEAITYRFKAHCSVGDDVDPKLRTKEELEHWMKKCPIKNFEKILVDKKILITQNINQIKHKLQKQIERAVEFGRNSPLPDRDELLKDVFK
ncbi:MAG: thiamine pyrophosphate-dependent dehydrogenase E1 component subunit alpha [Thermoplasmatales archaeon]|nr:thiamine pyrophosphate-dependent dehydrogenase E1 component subunit alpha [Thermoplasmatales archaeon]